MYRDVDNLRDKRNAFVSWHNVCYEQVFGLFRLSVVEMRAPLMNLYDDIVLAQAKLTIMIGIIIATMIMVIKLMLYRHL